MENKKSFILYCDLIHLVEKLPDEKAGELFKHILRYVNDQNPQTDDMLLQIAFEPIKQSMKRDLVKWEEKREERSKSGLIGSLRRWNTDLYDKFSKEELSLDEALEIAKNRKASLSDNNDSYAKIAIANDSLATTAIANVTKIAVSGSVSVNGSVIQEDIMSNETFDTTAPDSKITAFDSKKQEAKTKALEEVNEILEIFNAVTGKKCIVNKSRIGKINKLLKAGYTKEDFRAVVEMKHRDWSNDEKMAQYLTPDTIFGEEKFTKYVELAKLPPAKSPPVRKMVW